MKTRINKIVLASILSMLPATAALAATYSYDWDSLRKVPVPAWFDEGKFGIFIHWGPYSVAGFTPSGKGYAEHFPRLMYARPESYYPFLRERFGSAPPDFGYKDIVPLFQAQRWDPDSWAELFQRAGARYVILTAEHHDGFAMYDSSLTDWCALKMGPKRDLVGGLGRSVRARDLKFGLSYHRGRHPTFFATDPYTRQSKPRPDVAEEIRRHPSAEGLYGPFAFSDEFIEDYVARWQDIQRKYHPDFLWIDNVPLLFRAPRDPQTAKFKQACLRMITDYLNAAEKEGREVYFNNKGKHLNWPEGVGCREADNLRLDTIGPKWQNPATLGTSYGYLKAEENADAYKSPAELVHLLCDLVSKNGNLLLNIGPRPDGTIPEGMRRRLLAVGQWLETNGEAIYGSRPWKVFGETPELSLGPGKPRKNGDGPPASDIRFTLGKDHQTLYAILLGRQDPGRTVTITSLAKGKAGEDFPVSHVEMIGAEKPVPWKRDAAGLMVTLPETMPQTADLAVVLRIK